MTTDPTDPPDLADRRRSSSYQDKMGDDVCVFPISIFLSTGYGEATRLQVDIMPSKTVLDLKAAAQEIVGTPKEKLKLFLDHEELKDDYALLRYPGIKDGSVIYMSKKGDNKMTVFIKREYPRKETVAMVRAKRSLTILELKHKIAKKRGFPTDEQNLFFQGIKLEANASTTLKDYGIKEGSFVLLRLNDEPMKIKLEPDGRLPGLPKYIRAKPDTEIENLKTAIEKMSKLCCDDQRLLFQGTELENGSTFDDYGIKNGMAVTLKFAFTICVRTQTEKCFNVRVGPHTNGGEIKYAVASRMGHNLSDLHFFNGCERFPDDTTVEQLGLGPGDQLDVMLKQSGNISNFSSRPHGDSLTAWLMLNDQEREKASVATTTGDNSISLPTQGQLLSAVKRANAIVEDSSQVLVTHKQSILSSTEMIRLKKFLDVVTKNLAPDSKDIKITLGNSSGEGGEYALSAILCGSHNGVAQQIYESLLGLHKCPSSAKIALRRTEGPVDGCIGFHCDVGAKATVQIALNDDSEYDGGKLCFVTGGNDQDLKLSFPKRRAGTITSHSGQILHAVTKLHRGVRYGLFVLDRDLGLGDGDVHCVDAKTIGRFWQADRGSKPQ